MKKLLLLVVVAVTSMANAQVWHFKVGANVALPIGILNDIYSFSAGADLAYMFNVASGFELGVVTGYQEYFGKDGETQISYIYDTNIYDTNIRGTKKETHEIKNDNIGMIPLAAQLKYSLLPDLFASVDLGAGLFIGGDSETVFYYQPKVGYQSSRSEVAIAYRGMSVDGTSGSAISLGYAYNF